MSGTARPIRCERRGDRFDIVLDRPEKRNALTHAMCEEMVSLIDDAGADDDVKVVVIRAEGPIFTAGFDITDPRSFEGGSDEPIRQRLRATQAKADWMASVLHAARPVIVQVQGPCIGIGTMLVLVADFAIVADDAAFGFPEERFGSAGATWVFPFLTMSIGLKRATELVMTGRRVGADEAARLGLVNRAVAVDDLAGETDELAAALCTLPRDGIAANRAAKRLLVGTIGHDACFGVHAAMHPHAERIARGDDEYDFIRSIERDGMRSAIDERNEVYRGPWWGW
jgi:enoyl-CoA hydratase/carnithine racemase